MADEITTLGLGVDTSQVKTAQKDLDQLTGHGDKAATMAEALAKAMRDAGQASAAAMDRLERAVRDSTTATTALAAAMGRTRVANEGMAESSDKAASAGDRLVDSLRDQVATFGKGAEDLLRYRAAQAGVAAEAAPLILQLENQRAAQRDAATSALAEAQAQREAGQAKLAAQRQQDSFLDSLKTQAATYKMSTAEALAYRAALLGVSEQAAPYIKQLESAKDQTRKFGQGAKLTAQEAQQLSFQLNDLFVQIYSGGSPMTALVQQGSQLSGTFGGLKNTAAALSTVFTGTRLLLGGFAAGIGALAMAYYQGAQQSEDFRKSIILTGNAAGVTEGQFNAMAKSVANAANVSLGSSREILQGLVSTGQLNGDALKASAQAAQLYAKVTGASNEEVVKTFAGSAESVSRFAAQMNKSYNFLDADQLKYIRRAEEQQKGDEALVFVMGKLSERLDATAKNVGYLERAWNSAKTAAGNFWDAAKGVGRADTTDDLIADAEARLKALDSRRSNNPAATAARREAIESELAALQRVKQVSEETAKQQAESVETQRVKDTLNLRLEASLSRQVKWARAIDDANKLADKANATPNERKALLKNINDEYDPGAQAARSASAVSDIQRSLSALTASYQDAESVLETTRQAGLISDQQYYDAKRAFIDLYRQAQVKALGDENGQLQQSMKRDNLTTADRLSLQGKIKDNLAQINEINNKAAASTVNLGIQQNSAAAAAKKAYAEARQSAQDYLDTLTRSQDRELQLMGAGDKARQREQGRNQISDRYDDQIRQLENNKSLSQMQGRFDSNAQKQYDDQLALIKEFREKALGEWDKYYDARLAKESDWSVGAGEAMTNYAANANNTAAQAQKFYENAFSSMEDALVNFVMTGKLDFKSLANSIISDLVRIMIQKQITGIFGGTGGSGGVLSMAGSFFHGGGVVGTDSPARTRSLPASTWAGAPKFHSGMLASDEYPAILQKGESVLTAAQMRAMGAASSSGSGGDVKVEVYNQTGKAANAEATTQQQPDGSTLVKILLKEVANDMASGGITARATQGRFGLKTN
ncbi:phage tail tape measure protein, lambda family [Roseateles sp. YR242]|uniref:phage tail tape measure protein n=1 Tax=Roseateles sp. YR242 TaxID=1855305 RepID=UPI0008B4FD89|nr:phage tail tape measure protein [Roseateles sp. YR242]SEL11957.1 phage tail tape measure protein, lambda family [Roseateles sp. YR242]